MVQSSRINSLAFAIFLVTSHSAFAQESTDSDARFSLGSIEVIDVQGQQEQGWGTPLQATVNAGQMQSFERNDLSAALNLLPGITVQNSGSRSEKLVYVRGFNSRQVPLFIDGVPVYVPYDGNFDLSRILTFDVAEISVSKGFSSVLYGANTLGGSINVISSRPRKGLHASARSTVYFDRDNDDNAHNYVLSAEKGQDRWYVQGNVAWSEQDSFTLADGFVPTAAEDGGPRENSATRDLKVALKLGYTPNATDEYALSYQRQDGEKNTPPYAGSDITFKPRFWRWPDYNKESLYFISRTALGASEYLRTRVYHDTFYNLLQSFDDASYTGQSRPYAFSSVYDDYSVGASLELGSTRFSDHTLRAGLQYKRDVHREHDVGAPMERMEDALLSLGLEDNWALTPSLSLVAGAGWDQQDGRRADDLQGSTLLAFPVATADGWNAQAVLTRALGDAWSVHAAVARRTRFPTMKDRYSYKLGTAIPNPALAPENAVNLEAGVTGNIILGADSQLQLSAALFQSRIDDTIEAVTIAPTLCTSAPCSQLQNIGRQDNSGVELAATLALGAQVELHANYTWLDRDNKSSPALLPLDTPENKLLAYVQYKPTQDWSLLLSAQHESGRYSATNGSRRTSAYTTTDFKATWQALPKLQLDLGARNLGDELYAYEEGFPEEGRSWFAGFVLNY